MGEIRKGDLMYFTGLNHTFANGDQLTYGQAGKVAGSATSVELQDGSGIKMRFPTNKQSVVCLSSSLSPAMPRPLRGGFSLGEALYYTGCSETLANGERIVHGALAEVVGPARHDRYRACGLCMRFAGNESYVDCFLTLLSRDKPPPLPGGFSVGDTMLYTGSNETLASGDRLVNGQAGEVVGPAMFATFEGDGLCMRFDGNKGTVDCGLHMLSLCHRSSELPASGPVATTVQCI